ncbi:ATP-dependent Clp protease adapter ClpS [bacterium]|jgi:ATP-dependent Clp protease adaptor protein ClpS|nr:ATP-dependent Clp protease adapter ClpS [bacterium]
MNAVEAPVRRSKSQTRDNIAEPWQVVVLDDPVNLMEYVSRILIRIFGYSREKADALMMDVHTKGKAIVWSGGREKAEMYVNQLHSAQLHATLERTR